MSNTKIRRTSIKKAMEIAEILKEVAARGEYMSHREAAEHAAKILGYDVSQYTVQHLLAEGIIPDWPKRPGAPRSFEKLEKSVEDLRAGVADLQERLARIESTHGFYVGPRETQESVA